MRKPVKRSVSYKPRKRWLILGKQRIRGLLSKVPFLGSVLYGSQLKLLRIKSRFEAVYYGYKLGGIDIHKTFWISPEEIQFCSLTEFSINEFRGRVLSGDWDAIEKRFEDLDVYVAFKKVFFEGEPWSDTVFYKRILGRLEAGDILWGCTNKGDLDQRCEGLEDLFQRIETDGYKSQKELVRSKGELVREAPEVTISIGRKGDLLFSASAHRLSIAKLLGIPKIPVQVAVRHPEWMQFREDLSAGAIELGSERDQILSHPDLDDLIF